MTTRMTARAFRARFNRLEEPTLVGDGIWFPKAEAIHIALAEGHLSVAFDIVGSHLDGDTEVIDDVAMRPLNLSKKDQAKGKMPR